MNLLAHQLLEESRLLIKLAELHENLADKVALQTDTQEQLSTYNYYLQRYIEPTTKIFVIEKTKTHELIKQQIDEIDE